MSGSMLSLFRSMIQQKLFTFNEIKQYGFIPYFKKVYQMREAWWDKKNKRCVGTDQYGNTYWETETPTEHIGRNRWVELKGKTQAIYDSSQVPPEWHMWLHRIREQPPSDEELSGVGRVWRTKAWRANQTGTVGRRYSPGHFLNPAHKNPNSAFGTTPLAAQEEQPNNVAKQE